jgi:hypothetical protein
MKTKTVYVVEYQITDRHDWWRGSWHRSSAAAKKEALRQKTRFPLCKHRVVKKTEEIVYE